MVYIEQDKTYEYDGRTLIVKRAPRHFWPCQNCVLSSVCAEHCEDEDFPECRAEAREDGTPVVFFDALVYRSMTGKKHREKTAR